MTNFQIATFILYAAAALFSSLGFGLFVWWGFNRRGVTKVYAYITLLFLAVAIEQSIEAIGYFFWSIGSPLTVDIVNSKLWPLKTFFVFFVMMTIVVYISSRIWYQSKRTKAIQKREIADPDFRQEILIIDDQEQVIEIVTLGLKHAFKNITIYTCNSGEKGLEIFREHPNINLILTDILLPKMNGFELCTIVKQECPGVIMIGMTGYLSSYEFWAAREIGFDDYVQKPFKVVEIVKIVREEFHRLERWKKIRRKGKPKRKVKGGTIGSPKF